MNEPSRYTADRLVLMIMLLAASAFLFFFGGVIFIGILKSVSA